MIDNLIYNNNIKILKFRAAMLWADSFYERMEERIFVMKKIMVVDDSGVQRKMIIQIIRKAGYTNETLEAGDGEQAIEVLGANFQEVGLVLCDWNMPKMSGLDFIGGIAKIEVLSKIPVIMVTTEGTAEKISQAKAVNPNLAGYVAKPFTPDQLKAAITPILGAGG